MATAMKTEASGMIVELSKSYPSGYNMIGYSLVLEKASM
jgi:hypothetical protein